MEWKDQILVENLLGKVDPEEEKKEVREEETQIKEKEIDTIIL